MSSTPPPPPPPMPPAGPAYSGGAAPQNGTGTAALVLGILGFLCIGPFGWVPALILGRSGMARADQGLATNRGVAQAGFIIGLIGTILAAIGLVIWIIALIVAASQSA